MRRLLEVVLVVLLLTGGLGTVQAKTVERPAPTGGILSLLPLPKTTEHAVTVAGRKLDYRATAGTL